jgi:DNA-directed RNA polymerase subunit RPC12/RpoP
MDQAPSAQAGQTFPCGNCGAQLTFDATTQRMKCPYCGHMAEAPVQRVMGAAREIPLEEGLRLAVRGLGTPVSEVGCKDCGATVNVGPNEQTTKCTFCGSQQVLAREASGQVIRPESMVPFQMDKVTANQRFGTWLAGLWFRPNDLKHMAKVQEMHGVYIPFWTFDAYVQSHWNAEAGYYYYTTESYTDAQGNHRTRQVRHTRWVPASGHRADTFDDVLVCASKGLPEELVKQFTTFQTNALVPYRPELLAGWRAESYALDLMPAWDKGEKQMVETQHGRCSRDVPGDTQRNLYVQNVFSHRTFKHVLLPVWIAAYRYNGKPFQFLVNGQTGEVVGKAPWSFWKIFLFSLFVIAVIGGIAYAVDYADKHKTPAPPNTLTPAAEVQPTSTPPATTPPKSPTPAKAPAKPVPAPTATTPKKTP